MKQIKGKPHPDTPNTTLVEVFDDGGRQVPIMGLDQNGSRFHCISMVGMFEFDQEAAPLLADYLIRLAGFIRHNAIDYTANHRPETS